MNKKALKTIEKVSFPKIEGVILNTSEFSQTLNKSIPHIEKPKLASRKVKNKFSLCVKFIINFKINLNPTPFPVFRPAPAAECSDQRIPGRHRRADRAPGV